MGEEEILKKYKLTEEEHDRLYKMIKQIWTEDKFPVDSPIAIIIGGQTGAGKSGIIAYSKKMFFDDNVVVINSDEIKPFHPNSSEIAQKHPQLYTKITDQESNTWTSQLFEDTRNSGYNIIFEGTMKNNRIADDAIENLKKLGYTVIVRGLAVCDLESRLSILERYEAQVSKKGWGRLVVPEHHNQTYFGMPETIDYIEQNKKFDILEIFRRGSIPAEPELIYGVLNEETKERTHEVIRDKKFVVRNNHKYGFNTAKDSILRTREEDYDIVMPTCKKRFKEIKVNMNSREKNSSVNISNDEKNKSNEMFLDLMKFYEELKKKREYQKSKLNSKLEDTCEEIPKIKRLIQSEEEQEERD